MKNRIILLILIITFSCSNNDDRPNCLDINTNGDIDPVIMSCQDIQANISVDCTCD